MIVRYGRTVWNVDPLGYQPDDSILEVLVAAGAVWDPGGWWGVASQDRTSDYYVVTFTSEDQSDAGPVNETISQAGLLGGGMGFVHLGEVSLAHTATPSLDTR